MSFDSQGMTTWFPDKDANFLTRFSALKTISEMFQNLSLHSGIDLKRLVICRENGLVLSNFSLVCHLQRFSVMV